MASPNTIRHRTYQALSRRLWPGAKKDQPGSFHDPHQHSTPKKTSLLVRSELTPVIRFARGLWLGKGGKP